MIRRGFTIIELIITITIMAILLTLGVVNLRGSQVSARDVERKTDVETLSSHLETFYSSGSDGSVACPSGFIVVPGSTTYGTSDFCVMKYEAKNVGGIATSVATGTPWASISQTDAMTAASAVCTSCHLITEAEWLTIAQNVLSNGYNWSTFIVGSGYIYRGHSDNSPSYPLAADVNDSDGYYNTGQTSGYQKRTLKLSNGGIIWDLSGNVREWTSGQKTGGQPGIANTGYDWREWKDITTHGTLSPDPYPATTGISGASGWNAVTNYIGRIYSSTEETAVMGMVRGGSWGDWSNAGVMSLILNAAPGTTTNVIGFRVTYTDSQNRTLVNSKNGRYPSTNINSSSAKMTEFLRDIASSTIMAPGIDDPTITFVAAEDDTILSTANTHPTVNEYVYQPLTKDNALCTIESQECKKFNLYYRTEKDNVVHMVTSKYQ